MFRKVLTGAMLCVVTCLASAQATPALGGIVVGGVDAINSSTSQFDIEIFDPFFPGGLTESLTLTSGPFNIIRQQQQGTGDGAPTSFIDTEIQSLSLVGNSPSLGPMTVRIGAGNGVLQGQTLGRVENVVSNPPGVPVLVGPDDFVSGDSFFDVFFEIDVAGQTFYNRTPHRLEAAITELPPNGSTHFPPALVDIFVRVGGTNQLTDPVVGRVGGTHTVSVPEPSALSYLVLSGAIVAFRRRRT